MKKTGFVLGSALFSLVACSSAEKKTAQPVTAQATTETQPAVQSRSADIVSQLASANDRLSAVAMLSLPAYKTSAEGEAFQSGAARALETAKSVEGDIPAGHVLQITGHGNRHPDESQRSGVQLSVQRAKIVYDYFVRNGFPKTKLTYRGVGSAENDAKLSHDENRRVSFRIVKSGAAAN